MATAGIKRLGKKMTGQRDWDGVGRTILSPPTSALVHFIAVRARGKSMIALQEEEWDGAFLSTLSSTNS